MKEGEACCNAMQSFSTCHGTRIFYILTTDHVDRGNARSYSDHDGIIPWMSSPRTTVGYV